jgi:hypothetical protein
VEPPVEIDGSSQLAHNDAVLREHRSSSGGHHESLPIIDLRKVSLERVAARVNVNASQLVSTMEG